MHPKEARPGAFSEVISVERGHEAASPDVA
jgi:hypothetical protein